MAPYNTFYSLLEEHLVEAGIEVNMNKWDEPLTLGMVDPHDSLSHPAGVSDAQAESATRLDADQFTNFLVYTHQCIPFHFLSAFIFSNYFHDINANY